jgi:hypothetical protein
VQTCWKRAQEILQLWTAGDRVAAKLEKKPKKKKRKTAEDKERKYREKEKIPGNL